MSQIFELPRQPDANAVFLHFTGGFRAANVDNDMWRIEPVLINEKPSVTGLLTKAQLADLTKQNQFRPIAFHSFGWVNGQYYSSWAPIVPGKSNHSEGPAELWGNIAGNIARPRTAEFFKSVEQPNEAEINEVLNAQEPTEALARYISLSLRSMDISVQQIVEYYHEQLVNHMADGGVNGEKSTNTLEQTLFTHVHSFFLHLGAARDYLGALVAHRVGYNHKKIDSMARVAGKLRQENFPDDAILNLLIATDNIAALSTNLGKFAMAGWMKEMTNVRNTLVHSRPYGSKFFERFGWVIPLQKEAGIYRYFRPIDLDGNAEQDVLDIVRHHYARCTDLFHKAANVSGNNSAMLHLTDDDVISLKIKNPNVLVT